MNLPVNVHLRAHVCVLGDRNLADYRLLRARTDLPRDISMQFWGLNSPPFCGEIDAFIASVSSSTWARAGNVSPLGPQLVRFDSWPWGFPWLPESVKEPIELANSQLWWAISALKEASVCHPFAGLYFLFPGDLGQAHGGRPASPWQLDLFRRAATELGLFRTALFQCEFGVLPWPSPLGVLSCPPW